MCVCCHTANKYNLVGCQFLYLHPHFVSLLDLMNALCFMTEKSALVDSNSIYFFCQTHKFVLAVRELSVLSAH